MGPAGSEIVAAWLEGWALSRGLAPPVEAHGGWRVEVGLPDQKRRFVFPRAGEGVGAAARANGEPHVFLKVCASEAAVRSWLPAGWRVQQTTAMMVADDLGGDARAPPGYRLRTDRDGMAWRVRALDPAGRLAASGRMTSPSPGDAVFDRIETDPDHRRRGLGRAVMAELSRVARADGARRGLLVATADGRALYETLGWRVYSPYTTAAWSGASPASGTL